MPQMCLVSSINQKYLIAFKVFLTSLLKYNPKLNLDYIVYVDSDISSLDLKSLNRFYKKIIFKTINKREYESVVFSGDRHWEFNPAYRLEIFKLNYDKIIYFDVDAICLKNIDDILSLDYDFAAIEHELHDFNQIKTIYNFKSPIGFNGGLLIIKKRLLEEKNIEHIKEIMNSSRWYGNQGPLNIFFQNEVSLIDKKYFLPTTCANLSSLKDASFIHFLGEKKPWFSGTIKEKYSDQVLKFIDTPTVIKIQNIYDKLLDSVNEQDSELDE